MNPWDHILLLTSSLGSPVDLLRRKKHRWETQTPKGAALLRAEGQISSVGASEGSHHTKSKIFGIFGNNSPISGSISNHHYSKGTNGHEGETFGEPTLRELKQLRDRGEKWDLWSFLGDLELQGLQPFLSLGGRSQTLLPSA